MKYFKFMIIIPTIFLFSCLKKEEQPEPIVDYGGLGGVFPPSVVFDNLTFYKQSDTDKKDPLLTITIVADNHWKNTYKTEDIIKSYELVVTSDDLK